MKFGLISVLAYLLSANASLACRCSKTTVEQNYKTAYAILEGKVLWTFEENRSNPDFPRLVEKDTYAAIQFTKVLKTKNGFTNTDVAALESIIAHKKVMLVVGWVNTGYSCSGYDLTGHPVGSSVIIAFRGTSSDDTFEKLYKEFDSVGPCSGYNEFFTSEDDLKEYREYGGNK